MMNSKKFRKISTMKSRCLLEYLQSKMLSMVLCLLSFVCLLSVSVCCLLDYLSSKMLSIAFCLLSFVFLLSVFCLWSVFCLLSVCCPLEYLQSKMSAIVFPSTNSHACLLLSETRQKKLCVLKYKNFREESNNLLF